MARLSDLPNEITLMIIQLVLPDDVESFTSTCQQMYNLAGEELERHRCLKQKHAVYRFSDPYGDSPRRNLSQLLDEILQEPRTAFYVRELSIHGWFTDWDTQEESLHLPYSEESMSRLEKAVANVVPLDQVRLFLNYLEVGSEEPIISLLLVLLPNLSKLTLEYLEPGRECLLRTLYQFIRVKQCVAPLSRLRHVQILYTWGGGALNLIGLFFALPSIRSIDGLGIASNPDVWLDIDSAPRTSNLEVLNLTRCSIDFKRIFDLLECFKALRSFTYDPLVSARNDWGVATDPFIIRGGLSAFAKSTLESLKLLSHKKRRQFMGDIRSFQNLRNLHSETQLLLRKYAMSNDETSLAKALPPKLETLKLEFSGCGDEMEIAELISTLAALKTEYVPALRKVEVLTRNGVKDFCTSQHHLASARGYISRIASRKGHSYDAVAAACKAQEIDLIVKEFDTGVIEALDEDAEEECICQKESIA